jgi:ubiquinone/menaquinone biosynthesis C-methylase UbiE
MSKVDDTRFWDRGARKYARGAVADPAGYERTLDRTRGLLRPDHGVLELGCGTGSTALRLADGVRRYLATDISTEMIAIAQEKLAAQPVSALALRTATVDELATGAERFDAVLGFNYLHLVRDLPGTLRGIHALLASDGLFVSKTPCLGDMPVPLRLLLLPAIRVARALGKAPHVSVFDTAQLSRRIEAAGFELLATERHGSKRGDPRAFIVARRR